MSRVAMKDSENVVAAPVSSAASAGRVLAIVTAVFFGLSACETMKSTMDSINIFDDDNTQTASADAKPVETNVDPRKRAVMQAGVEPLPADYVEYYMDQQEAKLRKQLSHTGLNVSRRGETIILSMPGSATFSSGSSEVDAKFYPVLDSVGLVLGEYDQTYVDVIGHTDSQGSREYNQRLSEKRAKSVARYLETRALAPQRVKVDGMGEKSPIASNDTREGRAKNRRVEIKLIPVT